MRDQKLYESVGKYIDKYYIDKPDDIKLDKEMKSIFDRISEFRKKKATKKCDVEEDTDIEIDESAVESFDVESMQKTKAKNIMQMLFQAGLGEAMKGVPFKSERELKMGLSNIEKFLMAQAIESCVRDDVLDVMRLAFVDKGINSEVKSAYQPVISKNFNHSHFKMTLPVIKEFADRIEMMESRHQCVVIRYLLPSTQQQHAVGSASESGIKCSRARN